MYEAQLTQKSLSSQASVNMMWVFKVAMSQCINYRKKMKNVEIGSMHQLLIDWMEADINVSLQSIVRKMHG